MSILEDIQKQIDRTKLSPTAKNVGKITEVGDGVARVSGLSDVSSSEIISFSPSGPEAHQTGGNNIKGLALNLEEDSVGVIILGDYKKCV